MAAGTRLVGYIFLVTSLFYSTVQSAILGDGTRSLYSGNLIDTASSRGSCLVEGREFPSETAVPRDHTCHYCICYQGQVSCYWKACGPAPEGCSIMYFEGKCNPSLYKCTVPKMSMAEPQFGERIKPLQRSKGHFGRGRRSSARSAALSTKSSPAGDLGRRMPVQEDFPVEINEDFLARVEGDVVHRERRAVGSAVFWQPRDKSCTILGVKYNLGEVIGVASDPCLECRCAAGDMYCSPRCCFLPASLAPSKREEQKHDQTLLQLASGSPPPHPLSNIRNQVMPGNSL